MKPERKTVMRRVIPFENNKGKRICLPANVTIAQLVQMGIRCELIPKDVPVPDNCYVSVLK